MTCCSQRSYRPPDPRPTRRICTVQRKTLDWVDEDVI
jgi:hypothetical protein